MEVWFLIVTLFVLKSDGTIHQRDLYSQRQPSETVCEQEAQARIELYEYYLGKDHIRRFSRPSAPYCTYGYCQEDDEDDGGTYSFGLNGTLVRYEVGCEIRKERDPSKWSKIPENGKLPIVEKKDNDRSIPSF